jgi:hypothetical protein
MDYELPVSNTPATEAPDNDGFMPVRQIFWFLLDLYLAERNASARRQLLGHWIDLRDTCRLLWYHDEPVPNGYHGWLKPIAGHHFHSWLRRGAKYSDAARLLYYHLVPAANVGPWLTIMDRSRPKS